MEREKMESGVNSILSIKDYRLGYEIVKKANVADWRSLR